MTRQQRRAAARAQQTPSGRSAGDAPAAGVSDLFEVAVRHHQMGRLAEAEAHYRTILAIRPGSAEVLFNLAVALKQQGKFDEAVVAYRRTIEAAPNNPEVHYNLGNLLFGLDQLDEAIACYRRAIQIKPQHADAHCNLGAALKRQGKLTEAIAAFRRTTAINVDHGAAFCNLADTHASLGGFDDAIVAYRAALRIKPDSVSALCGLGAALTAQGQLDQAAIAYRRATEIKPDNDEAHYNLANALKALGRLAEAAVSYRQAIAIKPNLVEALVNLGNTLNELGQPDAATAAYGRAIEIAPGSVEAHYNIGNVLKDQGRLEEAVAAYRQAIAIEPAYAEAHANLAIVLMSQGRLAEALDEYRQAIALKPDDADIHSNYLLCLNYNDAETPESVLAAHRAWDRRFGQAAWPQTYSNDRTPARRLRIGYVSPDLRSHSVTFFFEPLLKAHDRQAVDVFCYSDVLRPDAVTNRLQGLADHWLSTVGLSDDEVAARIRSDGIDILVDLAGHTAWNRLRVFARRPAPVQVTWLGYANTTGVAAIDYRLVDAVTDPVGTAEVASSETLLRLPGGFLCYGGLHGVAEPTQPPCLKTGMVTFGSFNNPVKLSEATFEAWAKLLVRLPHARLLLKGKSFADAATRALVLARFGERGVAADRIELLSWLSGSADHLALYDRVDIALDPFPYNGTTTTCEALWMGVPLVTLRGDRHCGRVGASLLTQVGLTDWIADSVDDYAEIAVALAENRSRLHELRRSLRARLLASPLCDAASFARKVENSYRTIWQNWCETPRDNQ